MRCITLLFSLLVLNGLINPVSAQDDYVRSLQEINEQIRLGIENGDLDRIATGHYDRAVQNFKYHLRNRDVIDDLISSATIYRRLNDDYGFYKARLALANFYIDQEIFADEAVKLTEEAYNYHVENGNLKEKAFAVSQLGKAYQRKLDYEKAILYVEEGLKSSIELQDTLMELSNWLLITQLLSNLGNVEKVIERGEYVLEKEREIGRNRVSAEINYIIGSTLLMDDQIEDAVPYLDQAVSLNEEINDLAFESNELLSKAFFALDSSDLAYINLLKASEISHALYNQEKYAMANQSAIKYQAYEKDKEIRELEEDNEQYAFKLTQRTRLFLIISAILALTALAGYNYYRLQRQRYKLDKLLANQKEEIAEQKINELESTLKIENLQSMVIGQEAERSRIS